MERYVYYACYVLIVLLSHTFPAGRPYVAEGEIRHFRFEDAPSYTVVLYCWGYLSILTLYDSTVPDLTSGQMGLGQPPIGHGDKVCILTGAKMPFVLRKVDKGRFFLLGPAYVDGVTGGEATMVDGFEKSLRTFEIC